MRNAFWYTFSMLTLALLALGFSFRWADVALVPAIVMVAFSVFIAVVIVDARQDIEALRQDRRELALRLQKVRLEAEEFAKVCARAYSAQEFRPTWIQPEVWQKRVSYPETFRGSKS